MSVLPMRRATGAPATIPIAQATSWAGVESTLDTTTLSRVTYNNCIAGLFNGPDVVPERHAQIAQASLILIKTFEFLDDATGRDMVARLLARARAGATVVIQYDFKGTATFPRYFTLTRTPKVLWPLRGEPNVFLVPCYTPSFMHHLALPCCHKKYFITFAPGKPATLLTGGMNIGDAYHNGGFAFAGPHRLHGYRDTDVVVRGPVVRDAVGDFLQDMQTRAPRFAPAVMRAVRGVESAATYAPTVYGAQARLIVSPERDKVSPFRLPRAFETLLAQVPAGQTVLISNAFFSPRKSTRKAMIAATRRGVKFVILNNARGVHDSFGSFMGFISHGVMRRLMRACEPSAMRLYEWHSCEADSLCSIHQKVTVFGDAGPLWVGSANLDTVSANRNDESVLLVDDPDLRRSFCGRFYRDLRRSNVREIALRDFGREGVFTRFAEALSLLFLRDQV